MDVVITNWALQSYLDHLHKARFDRTFFTQTVKPDARLLKKYPTPVEFSNDKFWSPFCERGGFKMKWHQVGPGRVQLRLPVCVPGTDEALLCAAYVKNSAHADKRAKAKFKRHINQISQGTYIRRGVL